MVARLLDWYAEEGRDLPWRGTRDPYRIWLSEIMLQQTTVAAVIDYYQRFLKCFPDVQALAASQLEDVLTLWAGLGYYSRARNLHKAAKLLVDECDGLFPQSVGLLQQLPGVGRSTAGAIAALAFDKSEPILDGNVRRVFCRLLAIRQPARERMVEQRLWSVAEQLVPESDAHDYTQAIMDLGATVCRPSQPDCDVCPLRPICQAKMQNITSLVPVRGQKQKKVPIRRQAIMMIEADDKTLIRRRKTEGLLGGMLEFPTIDLPEEATGSALIREFLAEYGCPDKLEPIGTIAHTYSHFRLEATVYKLTCRATLSTETEKQLWHIDADLDDLALHGAHKKALALRRTKEKET
jgi:A/G-specific adenine glycosylase